MEKLEIVLKSFCDFSYKNEKVIARLIPSTPMVPYLCEDVYSFIKNKNEISVFMLEIKK